MQTVVKLLNGMQSNYWGDLSPNPLWVLAPLPKRSNYSISKRYHAALDFAVVLVAMKINIFHLAIKTITVTGYF